MQEYCLACNYLMTKAETMNYTHINKKKLLSYKTTSLMLFWVIIGLTILPFKFVQAQSNTCQFKTGTITFVLTGQSTGINITSNLILTNTSGVIQYVSPNNTTTFSNIPAGNYLTYGITHENASVVNLAVGTNVNSINSCYKTSAVPTAVCDCNNSTGTLAAISNGKSNVSGQTNKYVLTDGKGQILAINNVPNFTNYNNGVYNMYAVSYDSNGAINGLAINNNIVNVTGSCVSISSGIGYIVCIPEICKTVCVPFTIVRFKIK